MQEKTEYSSTNTGNRTPLQAFFLARLAYLLEQRDRYAELVGPDDWRRKLIGRCIYSTYCDCLEQGVGEEARALLARARGAARN